MQASYMNAPPSWHQAISTILNGLQLYMGIGGFEVVYWHLRAESGRTQIPVYNCIFIPLLLYRT
jgi:hypothetical protein